MTIHLRRTICILAVGLLVACSNSGDDESTSATTAAGGDTTATTSAGGGDRDTFVPISGVPGVTDDTIGYAVIGTRANNPLGTCILDCYRQGIEAYFAFRNDEGGIYGRQLVVSQELDDELAQNQVRALEVIAGTDSFGDFNATLLATGFGDLDDNGVPTYVWGINGTEMAGRQSIFGTVPSICTTCTSRTVPYAVEISEGTKVGVLGYGITENSKQCAQATSDSIDRFSADIGAEMAYFNDDLDYGLPNGIGPEVTAMKDVGVDFISTCIDLNGMKTLAQELERQGMHDVVLYHPNTYNQQFVAEAGGIFDGDIVSVQFLPFEADAEGTQLADFLHWMDETGAEPSELAMAGWINADEAFQGLLAAGPQFDRASVIAATNRLTDYTAGGLIEPVDWSTDHTPITEDDPSQECSALVRVVDGAFEMIAPPDKPWFCWDNATRDWAEPVPTSFQ